MNKKKSYEIKLSIVVFLFIITMFGSGCSKPPMKPDYIAPGDYTYAQEYISWLIHKEMKRNKVMGLSIAMVDDQKTVWAQGFGYADVDRKIPVTPQTVYRIGSISKLFTVMATMKLAEKEIVNIDRPLAAYLPQFSINSRFNTTEPITLRSIMTHHSGLPSDMQKGMWTSEPPQKLLERLKHEYAAHPPNYVLAYSNAGMGLLGLMIQKVSRTEFSNYMDQAFFYPLGMTHSSYRLTPHVRNFLSKGYRNGKEGKQLQLREMAAGAMYSNVIDLGRFMQMVFAEGKAAGNQILETDTIAEMLRPQNENNPLDFDMQIGLGWFLDDRRLQGHRIAGHGGGTPFFRTQLIIQPEKKLGVAVLTNSTEGGRIAYRIALTALKHAIEAKTGPIPKRRSITKKRPDYSASQEMISAFVGRYANLHLSGSIELKKEKLYAHFLGESFILVPSSDGQFGVEKKYFGIIPATKIGGYKLSDFRVNCLNTCGRNLLVVTQKNKPFFVVEKVKPPPLTVSWQTMLGDYRIVNPDRTGSPEDISLSDQEGMLVLSFKNPLWSAKRSKINLIPLDDNEAITLGLWRNSGETIRIIRINEKEGLYYSGYELEKIQHHEK